jgi:hypothetical protein
MPKQTTVTLADIQYVVPAFNMNQLEEVGLLIQADGGQNYATAYKILRVALRRATPPLDDKASGEIQPTVNEVREANEKILEMSGLATAKENPTQAAPQAAV